MHIPYNTTRLTYRSRLTSASVWKEAILASSAFIHVVPNDQPTRMIPPLPRSARGKPPLDTLTSSKRRSDSSRPRDRMNTFNLSFTSARSSGLAPRGGSTRSSRSLAG